MTLILRGGHVLDPSQGINEVLDVAVEGRTIVGMGDGLVVPDEVREIDVRGKYVCPGLVDLHGHWYQGSAFGIDPGICLSHGVTTVVDAGTSGFVNFGEFRRNQINRSQIEVLAFLNISALGIPTTLNGESEDLRLIRPKETAEILAQNSDVALGIKFREGNMCGHNATKAFECAMEAAKFADLPVMVHVGTGSHTASVLKRLRPGDILTHCFQGRGEPIVSQEGLLREALSAKQQGVIFDVGHGCGSFSWDVARKSFEHYFYPDTISTDLHRFSVERWALGMPTTMSKFLHLGMSLEDVILKSTWVPAQVIGRSGQLGTLKVGTVADIFVFELEQGEFLFEDTHLKVERASRRLKPSFVLKDGEVVAPIELSHLRRLQDCDYDVFGIVERTA
jgi:dihydroorotase